MSLEFLLITLIVVASPGTGVVYTLAAGLSRGARASVLAAFACTLGVLPHLAAALMGVAALLHASALAFNIVKYAGVAYLLFMAWQTFRERGTMRLDVEQDKRSALRVVRDGIVLNLLNPKLSIFFVAFLPQFIAPDSASPLFDMLALSGVFTAMTFVVFVIYGLFAAAARDHVLSRPRVMAWLRNTFAAAFVGLGAKLAFTER
jgi:threonine/homoserine/homoserine lactone efflux protein